jgi:hypothetical protein
MLMQICVVVATVALVVATVVALRFLMQARRTAKQVEQTMAHIDRVVPSLALAIEELRGAIDSANKLAIRVDRVTSDFEHVSGKALDISNAVVNRVLGPAQQMRAILEGLRTGASFLFRNGRSRARVSVGQRTGGGNSHARPEVQ